MQTLNTDIWHSISSIGVAFIITKGYASPKVMYPFIPSMSRFFPCKLLGKAQMRVLNSAA